MCYMSHRITHPRARYWGKRDTKLILPTNSSLSVTLDQDHLRSTTTSRADPSFEKDRLWLNGIEEEIKEGSRTATCIKEMKHLRRKVEEKNPNEPKVRHRTPRCHKSDASDRFRPTQYTSARETTSQQLQVSHHPRQGSLLLSLRWQLFTSCPPPRLNYRSSRDKALAPHVGHCSADT
jgi:hypothetical protein